MTTETLPRSSPPTAPPARRRLDGVDVARALAIIGMVSVHVGPPLVDAARAGEGGWYALPYGRASALFAFIAGVGITLGSRRGSFAHNAARLLWRAAWLAPVGLFLGLLGTPVAVILQYYAVWFVLAIPFLRAPSWVLAATTSIGVLVGPSVLVWARVTHPSWYQPPASGAWAGTLGDILLTGYYPSVSWIWLVLAGMLVGRLELSSTRTAALLVTGGGGLAVAAYGAAAIGRATLDLGRWQPWLDTIGHSDTPLETIAVGGVAIAVLGVCLLAAEAARPAVAPLAALGRFALTVYVGHIVVYAVDVQLFFSSTVAAAAETTAWITVVSTGLAMLWLAALPRGPLESLDRGGYEQLVRPVVDVLRRPVDDRGRGQA